MTPPAQQRLTERFLRYARTESQSDAAATTIPSTDSQRAFARMLFDDLTAAGATDVHLSDTCVVSAKIPGSGVGPSIGFCSHMDTVDVDLSPTVDPQITEYTGGDLRLGETWMRADEHPELAAYVGQTILHTDGTSVLGADDKAGVTAIMEAVAALDGQAPAGDVYVAFVPDEEIGLRGVRTIDFDRFPVDYAYTVDGGELGEVVEVTFNAATATIVIQGVSAHPMNAKGNLVNPITLGMEFASQLDPKETPEHTEGREGYIWCNHIEGNQSTCTLSLSIRDHDRAGYEEKKKAGAHTCRRACPRQPPRRRDLHYRGRLRQHLGRENAGQRRGLAAPARGDGTPRHRNQGVGHARRHRRRVAVQPGHLHAELLHRGAQFPLHLRVSAGAVADALLRAHARAHARRVAENCRRAGCIKSIKAFACIKSIKTQGGADA